MTTYRLYWSPTGQHIATVTARTRRAAIRKAPQPRQRDIALAQRDLAAFHRLTRELADLPFPGIAPLMDADKRRYDRKRTS